jgi:hypothetical protein
VNVPIETVSVLIETVRGYQGSYRDIFNLIETAMVRVPNGTIRVHAAIMAMRAFGLLGLFLQSYYGCYGCGTN